MRGSEDRRYLSFFSGALGLDLGLEEAGWEPLAVNEFEPTTCKTIRQNRPGIKLYDCDIRELTPERLCRELQLAPHTLFAIVGGPPCQAFSTAGRRLGLNDDRGNVFLHFIQLIVRLRPKYAVFENVRGLLSAPLFHRPHNRRGPGHEPLKDDEKPGGALLTILGMLETAGYTTTFTLYNMANYGVPQTRERLIFFSSRDGDGVPFIPPTHSETPDKGLRRWRTLRNCIDDLQRSPGSHVTFPKHRLKYFEMLKAGQNWRNLPDRIRREAMGASWNAGGGKTGFYRRLAWDKPSPTLVTRPNMPATALCHPTELRPLSVREYARIQTFPDSHLFAGNLDDQYRQIGNAVPPSFGHCIGKHLDDFDSGRLARLQNGGKLSRYVGTDHESWRQVMFANQNRLFN